MSEEGSGGNKELKVELPPGTCTQCLAHGWCSEVFVEWVTGTRVSESEARGLVPPGLSFSPSMSHLCLTQPVFKLHLIVGHAPQARDHDY